MNQSIPCLCGCGKLVSPVMGQCVESFRRGQVGQLRVEMFARPRESQATRSEEDSDTARQRFEALFGRKTKLKKSTNPPPHYGGLDCPDMDLTTGKAKPKRRRLNPPPEKE